MIEVFKVIADSKERRWGISDRDAMVDGVVYNYSNLVYVTVDEASRTDTRAVVVLLLRDGQTVKCPFNAEEDLERAYAAVDFANIQIAKAKGIDLYAWMYDKKRNLMWGCAKDYFFIGRDRIPFQQINLIKNYCSYCECRLKIGNQDVELGYEAKNQKWAYRITDYANMKIKEARGIKQDFKFFLRSGFADSTLEVYDNYLIMTWTKPSSEFLGSVGSGTSLKVWSVEQKLYYKNISLIMFCPPDKNKIGYIEFIVSGYNEKTVATPIDNSTNPNRTASSAFWVGLLYDNSQDLALSDMLKNDNTIPIDREQTAAAREIIDFINGRREVLLRLNEPDASPASSPADEIRKYKGLLDDGIITNEEYEAKKQQLLGL